MKKVVIVWKSNHEVDIDNFIIPYAYNAKKLGWFDDVEVLIWGASQDKVKNSSKAQEHVSKLIKSGITVYACKMCADNIDATKTLERLGVTVMYTGSYLSENLKDPDTEVITL